ncbi:uncharacterized protein LOC119076709 [Bradysia coprophila]|uniref:uncharacterized protein LOC119076709 n=1 Tax=Bradysia coprophila TaxID=38358 RepID=UPI00187DADE5|nr:uncharacterized protein LOC119076709 [Bradysia coprophila]
MVQFRLMIVLPIIIGVLQVCTANPISSEEEADPAKLFSADELERAKNAELNVARLVEGKSYGLTFEEMMKFHELRKNKGSTGMTSAHMKKVCGILVPELTISKDLTSAQEAQLPKMGKMMNHFVGKRDPFDFIRSMLCGYLSEPDVIELEANTFGLPLVTYLEMLFFKSKAEEASTSVEHVIVAKQICCLRINRSENEVVMLDRSTFNGELPDADLIGFVEQWNAFETSKTLKSLENVCDFLQTKEHTNDKCVVATPIDGPIDESVDL